MQNHDDDSFNRAAARLTPEAFRRRFLVLVLITWNIPPIIGFGFIAFVEILTREQIAGILVTPLEPFYILGWVLFSAAYLPYYARPVARWLSAPETGNAESAIRCLRGFPLRFWGLFLAYLLLAPVSVIFAAEQYTNFTATPADWFRIELVSLIVSIIVGLPIFFLVLDLFGRAVGDIDLARPVVTVRTKVFLIGALVPLLIDTMLIQYYWTRTGFFTGETFAIWVTLELLAIGGSLIFVHSFGQSLRPLRGLIRAARPDSPELVSSMRAQSTDEIGVLTNKYRRLLEKQREYSEGLERLVAERTAELERTNRELEAFSYSVSHDLRAPLRAIDGFGKALLDDCASELQEDCAGHLQRIRRATTKMGQLIDDLMNLSRVTRAEITPSMVDLSAMAREIIDELRQHNGARRVDVIIAPTEPARGDPRLLRIALANLLDNAWKYTGKSAAARIEFGCCREGDACVYYVKDNGVGFDPAYAGKLFGAFQRLHSEAEYPGTGIGLATLQRIVHRHGGRVWAEGEPNRGARFCFTLGNVAGSQCSAP
jgi:signal transduction histidine kinase